MSRVEDMAREVWDGHEYVCEGADGGCERCKEGIARITTVARRYCAEVLREEAGKAEEEAAGHGAIAGAALIICRERLLARANQEETP